jgi:hypothetical protein
MPRTPKSVLKKNAQKNRLSFHEWIEKEINFMISQKKESEEFRRKILEEEKKQINQQYEKMKSKISNKKLSVFEKIRQFFK